MSIYSELLKELSKYFPWGIPELILGYDSSIRGDDKLNKLLFGCYFGDDKLDIFI